MQTSDYSPQEDSNDFLCITACHNGSSLRDLGKYATKSGIYSDSCSVLRSISVIDYKNPIIRKLQHAVYEMKARGKDVIFCWVSGHVGIEEYDRADTLAKLATTRTPQYVPIYHADCGRIIKEKMREQRNQWQKRSGEKLFEIKEEIGDWPVYRRVTSEEVINGLRARHTWLTHHHLMEVETGGAVPCTYCTKKNSVKHILTKCEVLDNVRRVIFKMNVTI